jgi:membrane-associated protein
LQTVLDAIRSMPPAGAYSVIFALVFGEAAVFIGFVLPGETAVLIGGVLAAGGRLSLATLCVLVFVAAVVGDTVGYEVGRLLGPHVIGWRRLDRFRARLDAAQRMLRERGGPAVFLARFTAFLRAAMPGLAGLSRMRYRRFLAFRRARVGCRILLDRLPGRHVVRAGRLAGWSRCGHRHGRPAPAGPRRLAAAAPARVC